LLEIGARRKGERVRHTNLLSLHAWSPHNQAERRFVTFILTSMGGHGPFHGLGAPLAQILCTIAAKEKQGTLS
jgi:hypothetical protein